MAATKKVKDALAYIKDAEKSLMPDYDEAADYYNKAARCYKTAHQYPQCVQCYLKAYDNYINSRLYFAAAKALENALIISIEMGAFDAVAQLAELTFELYIENGAVNRAVMVMDKATKILEDMSPQRAIDLYRNAVFIAEEESRFRRAAQYQARLCRLYLRLRMYDKAADAIETKMNFLWNSIYTDRIGRWVVMLVLVQLAREDRIAMGKAFGEWGSYCKADEVNTLTQLLHAYDVQDHNAMRRLLRVWTGSTANWRETCRSRLARAIKKSDGDAVADFEGGASGGGGGDNEMDLC